MPIAGVQCEPFKPAWLSEFAIAFFTVYVDRALEWISVYVHPLFCIYWAEIEREVIRKKSGGVSVPLPHSHNARSVIKIVILIRNQALRFLRRSLHSLHIHNRLRAFDEYCSCA